jgi:hypothetical protein
MGSSLTSGATKMEGGCEYFAHKCEYSLYRHKVTTAGCFTALVKGQEHKGGEISLIVTR